MTREELEQIYYAICGNEVRHNEHIQTTALCQMWQTSDN